jgi:hypothetical protein
VRNIKLSTYQVFNTNIFYVKESEICKESVKILKESCCQESLHRQPQVKTQKVKGLIKYNGRVVFPVIEVLSTVTKGFPKQRQAKVV